MYWTLKRMLSLLISLSFAGVIIFYAYYQSRSILMGPEIAIETPENYSTATTSLLEIKGVASRAKALTLDGRSIFVDTRGFFDEKLLLSPGYNIIELAAKDGEGRETRKVLEIILNTGQREQAATSSTATTSQRI